MKFSEITFDKLRTQLIDWLGLTYNRSAKTFGKASPFGQVIDVQTELFELNMAYLKSALRMTDLSDPANTSRRMIRSIARMGQYDPSRSRCATGTLQFQLKPGVDPTLEIPGGKIMLNNRTLMRNESNNKNYSVDLGTDSITVSITPNSSFFVNIIQGKWELSTFTGTGLPTQSFSVQTAGDTDIDQDKFYIEVGSQLWSKKISLSDMLPNEQAYYSRTGIDSGMDIYFGNGDNGSIPGLGTPINVWCLMTDGQLGNVPNPRPNEFKFVEEVFDGNGEPVDVDNLFDITVFTPINYGSNAESVDFTKAMLPHVSTNNVIAQPEHFEFFFKRLGVFSKVHAWNAPAAEPTAVNDLKELLKTNTALLTKAVNERTDDISLRNLVRSNLQLIISARDSIAALANNDTIYIMLVPDIRIYFGSDTGVDYFGVSVDAFYLDALERERFIEAVRATGQQLLTKDFKIVQPTLKYYVVNIIARLFEGASEDAVKAQIRRLLSEHFITSNRTDRMPPSDIIALVESIPGVDSADVSFVSRDTEEYHRTYDTLQAQFQTRTGRLPSEGEIIMSDGKPYDPQKIIGLDVVLGDAIFNSGDLPLFRGGWTDRNGTAFADAFPERGFGSVNIAFISERSPRR